MRTPLRNRPGNSTSERASALVEFILVVPVFVALIFGLIEIGKLFVEMSRLNQTVFEVARRGGELPFDTTQKEIKTFAAFFLPLHEAFLDVFKDAQGQMVNNVFEAEYKLEDGTTNTDSSLANQSLFYVDVNLPLNGLVRKFFERARIRYTAPVMRRGGAALSTAPTRENPTFLFDCLINRTACSSVEGGSCSGLTSPCG